jgi:hypothetical protein
VHSRYLSAAAVALALAVSGAASGVVHAQQLTDSAEAGLAQLGFDTSNIGVITVEQAAQIENVIGGTESDEIKVARIDALLGHPGDAEVPQPLGVQQLEDSVAADMAALGIDAEGVRMLTLSELAQIENVVNSTDEVDTKRQRIAEIVDGADGSGATAWGVAQLQSSVSSEMAKLGLDAEVDAFSLQELAQIENVVNSSDPDDTKRNRIEQILTQ